MGQSEQLPISIGDYTPALEIQRSKNGGQHVHLARALIISISVGGGWGLSFCIRFREKLQDFFYHLSGVNTKDIKHYSYAVRRQLDLRQCLVPASLDNICDTLPMT